MKKDEKNLKQTFYISFLGINLCCLKKKYKTNDDLNEEIKIIEHLKKTK